MYFKSERLEKRIQELEKKNEKLKNKIFEYENDLNTQKLIEQDLTKKLYENAESGVINDTSYDQHPLKNYENTFPDSRFGTAKYWRTKFANNPDDATVKVNDTVKGTATAVRGATDYSGQYSYGSTILDSAESSNNVKSTKKHWWNRK